MSCVGDLNTYFIVFNNRFLSSPSSTFSFRSSVTTFADGRILSKLSLALTSYCHNKYTFPVSSYMQTANENSTNENVSQYVNIYEKSLS